MSGYLSFDAVAILLAPILILAAGLGLLALLTLLALRRRLLRRIGGTVDCGLRLGADGRWRLGVAGYDATALRWYRAFGATLRPARELSRRGLTVTGRRRPHRSEAAVLPVGSLVVTCHDRGEPMELAMSEAAATGLLAWLEAAPASPPYPPYPPVPSAPVAAPGRRIPFHRSGGSRSGGPHDGFSALRRVSTERRRGRYWRPGRG